VSTSDPSSDRDNWRIISARLDASERRGVMVMTGLLDAPSGRKRLAVLTALFLVALTVIGGAGMLGTWYRPRGASADLRLESGEPFRGIHTSTLGAASDLGRASLSDGSSIVALTADTHLEALAISGTDVVLHLVEGHVSIHVSKGGPRRWRVEAGAISIEVVGTTFEVSRRRDRSRVSVSEGVVLVRGAAIPDGIRRVTAGENVEVVAPPAKEGPPPRLDLPSDQTAQPPTSAPAKPAPRELQPAAAALMDQFDKARADGKWGSAQAALELLLRRFPSAPQAGLAAYQLAMLKQRRGAPAEEVSEALLDALRRANAESLRQDCYWRLVQVAESAGDTASARRWARASLREFPRGRYHSQLRKRAALSAGE
jgi:transmembrane sensor